MSRKSPSVERKDWRETVQGRKQRRIQPTLLALEDRTLLATFTVTNTADSGTGSLPYEIGLANSSAGANTITFSSLDFRSPRTITLKGTQLELSNTSGTQTIRGPSARVTVSGGGLSRVFQVDAGVTAVITGLTIADGKAAGGGGLYDDGGTATLSVCTISGNSASAIGGGVLNHGGTTTLNSTILSGNSAGTNGGGVYTANGTTTLTSCTVSGNSASSSGGGLYSTDATTTLTYSTIRGNSALKSGGGVASFGGTTTLTNVTVSGNTADTNGGGLLDQGGTTTLTNSAVSGNSASSSGGGLYTFGVMTTLIDVTVSGNSATSSGGGLDNQGGTATLTNVTVSENSAGTDGGGLYTSGGVIALNDVTVSGNSATSSGGGLDITSGTATLNNTIVAGQKAGGDISGVVSGSFNLIGTGGSGGLLNGVGGNIVGVANPGLAPLGNYGGPTQTMPLLYGSPAIAAGSDALVPAGITTDQTGSPRFFNGNVDIGAYELQVVIVPSFVVNITADYSDPTDGNTSLREAIASANALPVHTITFDPTVFATAQTITLAGLQLDLSDTSGTETIMAPAAGLTLSGGGLSRVLQVDAGVTASLSGLTITGGSAASGGGLYNDGGTTTLTNVTLSGNTAGTNGGGLLSQGGTTTLNNVTVSGNTAGTNGGGLFSQGGTITLTDVTVSGNSSGADGGGLSSRGGTTTLTNVTISGNSASESGGGLYGSGGTTTLTNVTVSGNSASESGGGLYASGGTTKLTNVTVSGNSASVSGGGLFSEGGATTLTNTIVAGQTTGGDVSGAVLGSFNLIGTGGSGGLMNGVAGNIVGVLNPGLAPLGDYGGPTQTMALLTGSAAIGTGAKGAGIPTTDQRGFSRQGAVDIGAFEVGSGAR